MDRMRFSTLAHREHPFCSPLDPETVDALLARLDLKSGQRILDVGCGKAEMLIRSIERYGVSGVGIDPNPAFLAEARRRAIGRAPEAALSLIEAEAARVPLEPGAFDVALCVGSTHAFGGLIGTLDALRALVRRGGAIVVGEGYWKREPDSGYLALLGGTRDEFVSHPENVARGETLGLTPRGSVTSSDGEWDRYEELYAATIERFAEAHPDDPDREAMLARIRSWNEGYRRWGRDTLGFGVYVFGNPS